MSLSFRLHGQVAQATISNENSAINAAVVYDGEGFVATTPNSGALHRNALVVQGGGTLTLASGADVAVQNDDNHTTFLRVGYYNTDGLLGGAGTLNILAGAALRVGQATRYANFHVGEGAGNTGAFNQSGGEVTVKGSFNVGVDGGTGTATINGGTFTLDHGDNAANHTSLATIGLNLNLAGPSAGTSNGTVVINGGTVNLLAHEWDPTGQPGSYGSVALILGNRDRGAESYGEGNGTLTQNGGVLHIDNHASLYLSSVGNGVYNLLGGTLEIGGSSLQAKYGNGPGTYAFNFGGGTMKVLDTSLVTAVNVNLVAGATSVVNTNGLNATFAGNLTAAGLHQIDFGGNSLVKTGLGLLTFSGSSRVLDTFVVTGGTARQTAGATSAVEFMAGSGSGNTGTYQMDGGTLTITPSTRSDGTTVVAGSFRVGDFSGTGTFNQTAGTVTVQDNGALNIGNQGGTGVYNLSGGTLNLNAGLHILGRSDAGKPQSQGTLNLSGGTLNVQNSGSLIIGNNLVNGLTTSSGLINQTGGVLHVDTASSLWLTGVGPGIYRLSGGTLEIGETSLHSNYPSGSATMPNFYFGGGAIKVLGADLVTAVNVELVAGATSTINTNGLNATLSGNLTAAGLHQIDFGGNSLVKTGLGLLTFSGSSRVFDTFVVAGGSARQTAGATSAVEFMAGSGSGNTGTYQMDGGTLTITPSTRSDGTTVVAGSFRVGDFSGTGTFNQTAGTVTVQDNGALNIGNQGGTGVYNLSGGTLNLNTGLHILGRSDVGKPQSQGTLNLSGGTLNVQNGASLIIGNNLVGGLTTSSGLINQTGGVLHVDNASSFWLTANGPGIYRLSGGTLEIGGTSWRSNYPSGVSAVPNFYFGGGTIKVSGADLVTAVNAQLVSGATSVINTNGLNATFTGNLTAAGLHQIDFGGNALVKTGLGTLTLSGASRVLDTFAITAGAVRQTSGATSAVEFMTGTGNGNTGSYLMSGGTFTMTTSTRADNTTVVAASMRVGDFGGVGTFTQTGGSVTVQDNGALNIGNQGGTGTYNLEGGSLVLNRGTHVLGRSTTGNPVSHGTLNISGGTLFVQEGGSLLNGNNQPGGAAGTGTITQTGGVLHVDNASRFYISGYSNAGLGTYSLNGGTLEIGGTSLLARYNNSTSAYIFNFGGGTIKVIGTDLTSAVKATLTTGTVSTLNTNGLNATWSGTITGQGGLTKAGDGALTLTGAHSFSGATTVAAGTLRVNGSLTASAVTVQNGATLAGHGGVFDANVLSGGTLSLGASAGGFAITDDLTLMGGSYTLLRLGGTASYDHLTIGDTFTAGGMLAVTLVDGFNPLMGASFALFSAGTISGSFSAVQLPALASGLAWNTNALYSTGTISVQVSAIPEPSTWAVIVGGVALVVAVWRRRAGRVQQNA